MQVYATIAHLPSCPDRPSVCTPQALDACANPYIALAALVTAGMMGIEGDAALPPPIDVDPASLPTAERLPTSLKQAIEALFHDAGGSAITGVMYKLVVGFGRSSPQHDSFRAAQALTGNEDGAYDHCIHITDTCLTTPLVRQACCLSQHHLKRAFDRH